MLEVKTNKKQQIGRNRLCWENIKTTVIYSLKGKGKRIANMKQYTVRNEHSENEKDFLKLKL